MENSMIEQIDDALAKALAEDCSDLDGVEFTIDDTSICAVMTVKGREYAHAVSRKMQSSNLSPIFRGWHAEIMAKLEREDNRPEAA